MRKASLLDIDEIGINLVILENNLHLLLVSEASHDEKLQEHLILRI